MIPGPPVYFATEGRNGAGDETGMDARRPHPFWRNVKLFFPLGVWVLILVTSLYRGNRRDWVDLSLVMIVAVWVRRIRPALRERSTRT